VCRQARRKSLLCVVITNLDFPTQSAFGWSTWRFFEVSADAKDRIAQLTTAIWLDS
jgi:hypothetical protein